MSEHIPECPVELFFWTAAGGDVYGQEELLEVYVAVLVGVERPEDVVAELVGVAGGEALAVDVHEGLGGEAAVRAVAPETPVPLLYRVLVVARRRLQELHVGLQSRTYGDRDLNLANSRHGAAGGYQEDLKFLTLPAKF